MLFFFIAEFDRAVKIRKIAIYHFLISFLVPGIYRFKDEKFQIKKCLKRLSKSIKINNICDVMAGNFDEMKTGIDNNSSITYQNRPKLFRQKVHGLVQLLMQNI